jgi:hypothetical protein
LGRRLTVLLALSSFCGAGQEVNLNRHPDWPAPLPQRLGSSTQSPWGRSQVLTAGLADGFWGKDWSPEIQRAEFLDIRDIYTLFLSSMPAIYTFNIN